MKGKNKKLVVRKICLIDVCISNKLVKMFRDNGMTVLPAKKILDPSAKFLPENTRDPWGDTEILEFARRKRFIIITADKNFAMRYEYGILVSANCNKPAEIQFEQAVEQYEMIKKNGKLRHIRSDSYGSRDTKPVFVEAFNETFHIPPFEN